MLNICQKLRCGFGTSEERLAEAPEAMTELVLVATIRIQYEYKIVNRLHIKGPTFSETPLKEGTDQKGRTFI